MKETSRYDDFVVLRDYLLKFPDEAKRYSEFKQELIKNNVVDRKEYRAQKSVYVSNLIERAKKYKKEG